MEIDLLQKIIRAQERLTTAALLSKLPMTDRELVLKVLEECIAIIDTKKGKYDDQTET